MSPDPAVEAVMADGSWNASPLGACGVRRMVRGRVAEGLVRLVREADTAALAADREPCPACKGKKIVPDPELVGKVPAGQDWQPCPTCSDPVVGPTGLAADREQSPALSEPPPEGESE